MARLMQPRLVLIAALTAAGCGGSTPAAPSTPAAAVVVTTSPTPTPTPTPGPTGSVPDPAIQLSTSPVSPQDGGTVPYRGDAAFTVTNASAPSGRPVLLMFQLSLDDTFANPITTATIPQAAGDRTTCHMEMQLTETKEGRTIYWRARPASGDSIGEWTPTRRFTITSRENPSLFAETPIILSPVNGSLQARTVTMRARAGAHSVGSTELQFFFSTSRTAANPRCYYWLNEGVSDGSCDASNLAPGTYYWWVQTATSGSLSSMGAGIKSAPTETQTFRVEAATLNAPTVTSPSTGAIVYPRPTFTVPNVARSGGVGAVSYRFDLRPNTPFAYTPEFITAIVPEGAGETSWTAPSDLVPGIPYQLFVTALDPANNFESQRSSFTNFLVANRSQTIATMTIDTRCKSISFPVVTSSAFGRVPFLATTTGSLALSLDAAVAGTLDQFTGTIISGSISYPYTGVGESSTSPPTITAATLSGDGILRGTFDGTVWFDSSYGGVPCRGTGFSWTIKK